MTTLGYDKPNTLKTQSVTSLFSSLAAEQMSQPLIAPGSDVNQESNISQSDVLLVRRHPEFLLPSLTLVHAVCVPICVDSLLLSCSTFLSDIRHG